MSVRSTFQFCLFRVFHKHNKIDNIPSETFLRENKKIIKMLHSELGTFLYLLSLPDMC